MGLPIIFLPGVMGSRLRFLESGLFWDPDSSLRMLRWVPVPLVNPADVLARKLHRDAPAEVMEDDLTGLTPDEGDLGWGGVAASFYVSMLRFLQANTESAIHAFGYDWRQDLVALVPALIERVRAVRELGSADQVILITHSMGGLLVRIALQQVPELAAQVAKVIHIFQPVQGAVVLYRRFFTGLRIGSDGGIRDLPANWVLGDSPLHFVTNVSGLPGALQLLPTAAYQVPPDTRWNSFSEPTDIEDLYAFDSSPPGLMPANASDYVRTNLEQRWPEVRAFHSLVLNVKHPNTWSIYGTELATDVAIAFAGTVAQLDRRSEGDGTVPASSGAALFATSASMDGSQLDTAAFRQWEVTGVEHSAACNNAQIQQAVAQLVALVNPGPPPGG